MHINRNNYEEYFILYMDNELGPDDRRMVEAFIQQHPDLKEELDSLLQYKFVPDTNVVFTGKEELLKLSNAPVTLTNYEEWLVLYMDNELTVEQKTTLDEFIAANPFVKEELALLQRTKLQPEEIAFSDKSSLYRTEENPDSYRDRPMPVKWWRIAAAAVLLLGIGITTAVVVNKNPAVGEKEIVKGTVPVEKTGPVVTPEVSNREDDLPVNKTVVTNTEKPFSPGEKQSADNKVAVKEKNNVVKNPLPVNVIIPQQPKQEVVVVTNNKPSNDLPQPLNNPNIDKNDATNKAIASDNTLKEIKQKDALTNSVVTTNNPGSSDIVNASFNDAELDQTDGKKNKNRGLFRKIARTFEKRAGIDPTDDNKLLVAGLAIKLK